MLNMLYKKNISFVEKVACKTDFLVHFRLFFRKYYLTGFIGGIFVF